MALTRSVRRADSALEAADSSEGLSAKQLLFFSTIVVGVFLLTTIAYPFRRPDYFLLADAFLHGRTWIDTSLMPTHVDVVDWQGHAYLPFGPGPALLVLPFVALLGPVHANGLQPFINAATGAVDVALLLVLVHKVEPRASSNDVVWIGVLFALSTPIWWVTVRTGPWHFAQLVALGAVLVVILELLDRRRPWLIAVALALAVLSRLTLVVAVPFVIGFLLARAQGPRSSTLRSVAAVIAWQLAALGMTAAYNQIRFGSPLESGYAVAALPPQLEALRDQGLFSLAHLPRNLDLLLTHLPIPAPAPFFLRPDGYGLSILIASPGLLLIACADWSRALVRWAAVAGLVVLVPSLLYYGGGWIQLGFRYMLDALPFIAVLVASAIRGPLSWRWKVLIGIGVAVSLWGIVWSYTGLLE